jgi:uncharacterized protein with PQ loop repeat
MNIIEFIGLSGSLILSLCSVPQVIESIKTGYSGMNIQMLWLWLLGALLMLVYSTMQYSDIILWFSYSTAVIFSSIILYYKIYPRVK